MKEKEKYLKQQSSRTSTSPATGETTDPSLLDPDQALMMEMDKQPKGKVTPLQADDQ